MSNKNTNPSNKPYQRINDDAVNFPRAILELHKFTSDDPNSPNLGYIDISQNEHGQAVAQATNGHHMMRLTFNPGFKIPTMGILGSQAKEMLKGIKKDDYFMVSIGNEFESRAYFNRVHFVKGKKGKGIKGRADDWQIENFSMDLRTLYKFPKSSDRLFEESRNATKQRDCVALDLRYLVMLHDFLKKMEHGVGVKLYTNGTIHDPCYLERDYNECRLSYIIMPIKI